MNAVLWGQKYPKHAHRIGLRGDNGLLFLAVPPSSGKQILSSWAYYSRVDSLSMSNPTIQQSQLL